MKYYLLIASIVFISCSKENSCKACKEDTGYIAAKVIYTGPLATDGCDWVVQIGDSQYYHPDNLKEEFRQNGLDVMICHTLTTDKFICGLAATPMSVIHVIDIRK